MRGGHRCGDTVVVCERRFFFFFFFFFESFRTTSCAPPRWCGDGVGSAQWNRIGLHGHGGVEDYSSAHLDDAYQSQVTSCQRGSVVPPLLFFFNSNPRWRQRHAILETNRAVESKPAGVRDEIHRAVPGVPRAFWQVTTRHQGIFNHKQTRRTTTDGDLVSEHGKCMVCRVRAHTKPSYKCQNYHATILRPRQWSVNTNVGVVTQEQWMDLRAHSNEKVPPRVELRVGSRQLVAQHFIDNPARQRDQHHTCPVKSVIQ